MLRVAVDVEAEARAEWHVEDEAGEGDAVTILCYADELF